MTGPGTDAPNATFVTIVFDGKWVLLSIHLLYNGISYSCRYIGFIIRKHLAGAGEVYCVH